MGKTRQVANLVSDNNIFADVSNNKIGIRTSSATSDLTVSGSVSISGIVTASSFVGDGSGLTNIVASSAISVDTATSALYATSAGIATYATTSGVSTYATSAGIATYATSAGIATTATNAQGLVGNPIINISGENNSGVSTLTDLRLASIADKISIQSGAAVTLSYNSGEGNVVYMTSATGPITLNVTGIPTTSDFDSKAISFSVFVQQGPSTAFACTSVTLNGVRFGADAAPGLSTHIAYASGTVATGSTSCIDVFNFTGINTTGSASSTANYKLLGNVNGNYRLY